MDMEDILSKAFQMSNEWKFFVQINSQEIKELTYLELGIFLTTNSSNIEKVHIILNNE